MRWRVLAVVALVACGPKAKPAPPPAEREVASIADIAGEWVADDEMSWSYALSIDTGGKLVGRIDRGKLPRCDREGTLTFERARHFKLAMSKNTCEQALAHAGLAELEVASFTGDVLTVIVTPAGAPAERRTYRRRPD
jgi:hypothetical protein